MDKKIIDKKIAIVKEDIKEIQEKAQKELIKVKKDLEKAKAEVESYVKKNPKEAALISAGIGAVIGTALVMLLKKKKK